MSRRRNQNSSTVSKELMLRDKTSGQWIKRSDEEVNLSENAIPCTLIQINQNIIHYTDTSAIIRKIVEDRHNEKIKNLEVKYNSIIDSLDNYRAYSIGAEKVFDSCERSASDFYLEIKRIAESFDTSCSNKEEIRVFTDLSKAYLKVIFTYLYSAFLIHKEKVKNETVILGKITSFKTCIQELLEKILIPSSPHGLRYKQSIYAMFIYKKDFNIEYLNDLVRYDRRFETPLSLIREININSINLSTTYGGEISLNGEFREYKIDSEPVAFVDSLVKLLRDIDRLHKIREEINEVEQSYIFDQYAIMAK